MTEPRLWSKERKLVQKATGDRTIESARDLVKWEKKTGQKYVAPSEFDNIMRRADAIRREPDVTDAEANRMVEEYHEETYGRLPEDEKIKALPAGRLLVRRIDDKLSEVLEIVGKKKSCRAVVEKVGPALLSRDGGFLIVPEVKVGDEVILKEWSGIDMGKNHVILDEDEILAVVKRD